MKTCYVYDELKLFTFLSQSDIKKKPLPNSPEDEYEFFIDDKENERVLQGFSDGFIVTSDFEESQNTEAALRAKYTNEGYNEISPIKKEK